MSITANSQLRALVHPNLNHSRLSIDKVLNSLDNLERILPVNLLPILKPLNHVINELLSHLRPESHAIIRIIHGDSINIQALKSRRRVGDLNGLLKFQPSDQFLALGQL